jgi:hypothetical protein
MDSVLNCKLFLHATNSFLFAEELGLITRDENPLGGVSPEEAFEFLNPTDALAGTMSMDVRKPFYFLFFGTHITL